MQSLFTEPIRAQIPLDPGYEGHASDVWLVRTDAGEWVVRASRLQACDNEFWWGVNRLFGIDPRRIWEMEAVNGWLSRLSSVPVPRVLRRGIVEGRPHVVVEKMAGRALDSFIGKPPAALYSLGAALARIHRQESAWAGAPAPDAGLRYPLAEFNDRLAETMAGLVERFYGEHGPIKAALPEMLAAAAALPAPASGALVMTDMDPTQFLWDGERITALVDTEAYVVAPRELDLIGLEYVLDADAALSVRAGYESVMPLPDLSAVRPVYRYFCRLIELQGAVELQRWMDWPAYF